MKPISLKLYLLAVLCICFATSCKKNNPNTVITGKYRITYTGNKFVGETLTFYCDAPDNVTISWGVYEQYGKTGVKHFYERTLKQVFDSVGTYYIVVFVNNDTTLFDPQIYVKINVPYNHADILKMCAPRLWNVVVDSQKNAQPVVLNQYTDSFGIQFINDTSVVFKNDTLKNFNSSVGVAKTYDFWGLRDDYFSYRRLTYYYLQDSIVYDAHPNQGGLNLGKSGPHYYGTTTHYMSKK